MNILSKIFFLTSTLLFLSSCSSDRAGLTTSKIKIIGGNAFSAALGTSASNGMIFYGRDRNGRSFTKIISDDLTDLVFPNGTWNFYAVAWDDLSAGANNNFRGNKKCAIKENIILNGTDAVINLTLNTATCSGRAFVSPNITSCKNNGLVISNAIGECSQANSNKGYATWMRVAIPEYKKIDSITFSRSGNALRSFCIKVSADTESGDADSSSATLLDNLSLPNDVPTDIEVFYSFSECDGSAGVDTYAFNTPKVKVHESLSERRYFVETNEIDVCRDQRKTRYPFATGFGTSFHPYGICSPGQWNTIGKDFTSYKYNSFEVLSDLNFNNGQMDMIGDSTTSTSISYSGVFNGNNHKIENGKLSCLNVTSMAGLFRQTTATIIKNITFNQIANLCKDASFSGGVVGNAQNTSFLNVKFFGAVSGTSYVGGLAGKLNNNTSNYTEAIINSHVNADIDSHVTSGSNFAGGLVGSVSAAYSGGDVFSIKKSSFKGKVNSSSFSAGASYDSRTGGIAGDVFNSGSLSNVVFDQLIVKGDMIEGSQYLGGIVGYANSMSISNSYSVSTLNSTAITNAYVGGLVGKTLTTSSIVNSFSGDSFKRINNGSDTTYGALLGGGTAGCSGSVIFGNNASSNNFNSCGIFLSRSIQFLQSNYSSFDFTNTWDMPTPGHDYPRLKWENSVAAGAISYLKRECVGSAMFQPQAIGAGTFDNPYLICTKDQFLGISPNFHYSLKQNLSLDGDVLPSKAPGKYLLNGNNYTISDFQVPFSINGKSGIFQELLPGSNLENLNLVGGNSESNSGTIIASHFGLVTGDNKGIINNVNINLSSILLTNFSFDIGGSPYLVVGGIAGINSPSGVITNSDLSVKIKISQLNKSGPSRQDIIGGIVGVNLGSISGIHSDSDVARLSSVSTTDSDDYTFVGGAAGVNSSSLSQLEIDGSLTITNNVSNTLGFVGPIVGSNNLPNSIVENLKVETKLYFTNLISQNLIPSQDPQAVTQKIIFNPKNLNFDPIVTFMDNTVNSICSIPSTPSLALDCYNQAGVMYQADLSGGLTVNTGSPVLVFPDWNVGLGMIFDPAYVWRLDALDDSVEVSDPPEIISASGSFKKIGKGF